MMVWSIKGFQQQLPALLGEFIGEVRLIYLFGSYAKGEQTPKSDIDIALMSHNKIASLVRWELQNALADGLGKEVDLVDLLSASTVMQNQIIQHGVCIYDPEHYAASFEMQVMSMYQHLNAERSAILQQYARG